MHSTDHAKNCQITQWLELEPPAGGSYQTGWLVRPPGEGDSGPSLLSVPRLQLPQGQPSPSLAWEWLAGVCQMYIVSTAAPYFQVVSTPPGASPCLAVLRADTGPRALRARNVWRGALGQTH